MTEIPKRHELGYDAAKVEVCGHTVFRAGLTVICDGTSEQWLGWNNGILIWELWNGWTTYNILLPSLFRQT